MSTTDTSHDPTSPAEAPAPATSPVASSTAPAAEASASAPLPAEASEAAVAPEGDAGHEDDGDDEPGEGDAGEGEARAAEGGEGGVKKKRKRRRRKKKGAQAADGAEGAVEGAAPVEGAEGASDAPKAKKKKPPVERERPAFTVGEVVFGKVIEVTEDVLFVDLAGKAKALFDLRELLITDDFESDKPSEPDLEAAEGESDETTAAAEGEPASPESAPTQPELPVEGEGDAAQLALAQTAEAAPVEATAAPAAAERKAEPEPQPQLPKVVLEPGAPFVGVVHNDGARGGLVVLTHHPKRVRRAKPLVAAAFRDHQMVFGLVTGVIKGGLEVDVDGLRAFVPASHMELRPGADLSHHVGKRMAFSVTQYAKRGRDVVLSRRSIIEVEAKEKREEALAKIEMGAEVDGVVRTVVSFGAFVDIGGIEGLVPLSEMSHNRGDQPKDVFKVGETVRVKVLKLDEKGKLWLSRRACVADPWQSVADKYAVGTKHQGKVVRLQPFGAFIELEPAVDGLVHTADLSIKRIEHPEEVVKVGDTLEVVVVSLDPRGHRIGLHPAPTGDAANEEPQQVALHKAVKVVVVSAETSGLAVRILGATGRYARGFIPASATGTPRGTELRKLFPVGKELEAKVIDIDARRPEPRLSIRAVNEDAERNAYKQYRAQVKREAKFGTLADLLSKHQAAQGGGEKK